MNNGADIEALINRIQDAIRARSEGTRSVDQSRDDYKNLLREYEKLEKEYISDDAPGFIKGLLYDHNRSNGAILTALFALDDTGPVPLVFCGDTVLMNALPELIKRDYESRTEEAAGRIPLAGGDRGGFFLALDKIKVTGRTLILAAVSSSEAFTMRDFQFLSDLLEMLFLKKKDRRFPVMLNYINDLSAAISRIVNAAGGGRFYIDHFFLLNPYEAFAHIGIYPMIEFSDLIVETLSKTYPAGVKIFAHSVFRYLVLYDEKIKERLDIKRNRIDFVFKGNSIPYKVLHREIDSPQALYLILEEL